jgi:hypothetical protein
VDIGWKMTYSISKPVASHKSLRHSLKACGLFFRKIEKRWLDRGRRMLISDISGDEIDAMVQIGGLIRFSVPCEGGFQKNPESIEEKLAALYAPARMEQRFAYFEQLCLHTLKRQTDQNFTLGVLVGEDMPEVYRNRLDLLLKDFSPARVISAPVMPHRAMVERAYNAVFDQKTPFRLSFRLDDDDAVSTDYIETVRAKLPLLLMMSAGEAPVCLTFSQGMTVLGSEGERKVITRHERSPNSAGLAVLGPAALMPLVMMHPHMTIHMRMPTLLEPMQVMNFRSLHASNDSRGILMPGVEAEMSAAETRAALQDRFALDLDEILAL